ncbi:MAG: hypothetical protein J2P36_38300 [Ktedonobacteraceae bacterium]|nr:hypothetical protein [Ktedonobacteraceae bacterium]
MFQQQSSGFYLAGAIAFVALLLILGIYFLYLYIGIAYWPLLLPVVAAVGAILYMLRPRSRQGSPNVGKANHQQRGAKEQAHEQI